MNYPHFKKFTLMEETNSTASDKTESFIYTKGSIVSRIADEEIKDFFIWMIREANIDVVDAETAIEVRSLEDKQGFVPVMTIDELITHYRECTSQKS